MDGAGIVKAFHHTPGHRLHPGNRHHQGLLALDWECRRRLLLGHITRAIRMATRDGEGLRPVRRLLIPAILALRLLILLNIIMDIAVKTVIRVVIGERQLT